MRKVIANQIPHGEGGRMRHRSPMIVFAVIAASSLAAAICLGANVARVVVSKKHLVVGSPPVIVFSPIVSPAIGAAGYAQIADYGTRTVYEGPTSAAAGLVSSLRSAGYEATVGTDLDHFSFHGFSIDSDTGAVNPPVDTTYNPTGDVGLYLLVFRSYPVQTWLDDLDLRQVRIFEELQPAAYIVRCQRSVATTLTSAPYVRGVFPLLPSVKKVGFSFPAEASPYRRVVIHAAVETAAESLRPYLESVARDRLVFESPARAATRYEAFLTDLDAGTLTSFENVFEVAATPTPRLSSERQAQLVAQSGSKATLPETNPTGSTYVDFLVNHGISSSANTFDNTRVGVIDSGFDNGMIAYADIHPDFKLDFGGQQISIVANNDLTLWGFKDDRDHHGTLVTSIIAGYPSAASGRTENPQNYRYGLGIAPTARCVVDKVFNCSVIGSGFSLATEVSALAGPPYSVNIVNLSFNDPPDAGCGYTDNSKSVDDRTRANNVLTVVAAGNSPEGCSFGNYVRSPATAKNALAVGSVDNYTINWTTPDNPVTTNTCAWNGFPPLQTPSQTQNATRVPDYSAIRQSGNLIKPDLVAPSTRVTGPLARGAPGCASPLCNALIASFTNPDVTYGVSAGTSFAAPVVSGAAAVVRKWYKNLLGGDPSPAMAKAILINGARDLAGARR